jgi:hypothetical protein
MHVTFKINMSEPELKNKGGFFINNNAVDGACPPLPLTPYH